MEIQQIIRLLLRKWWFFVVMAVVAGGIAFYISYFVMEPIYEATSTVFVNDKNQNNTINGIAYDQVLVNRMLIADYKEIIYSRVICDAVLEDLKLSNMTSKDILDMLTVGSRKDTRIMEITATSDNKELAMNVANSVAKVFTAKAADLMNVTNVNMIDTAQLPDLPVGPQRARNTALAVFGGLILAAGIILAIEYLDNTIKSPEDVENHLGLTVLGTIPELRLK